MKNYLIKPTRTIGKDCSTFIIFAYKTEKLKNVKYICSKYTPLSPNDNIFFTELTLKHHNSE